MATMSRMPSASAARPGLVDLIGVEDEVLAQHGGVLGCAALLDGGQVGEFALEAWVGQAGDGSGTVGDVGLREADRVEVGGQQPAGGRGLLDLRDEPDAAAGEGAGQVQGGRLVGRRLPDFGERGGTL